MKDPSDPKFAFLTPPARTPNRQRKRPIQERAQATVDAILKATFQVLEDVGMDQLTTTRVAERAGVSVGTLYQYYPDKAALVAALKAADGEEILASVSAALRGQAGRPLRDVLRATIAAVLAIKYKKRAYLFSLTDSDRAALGQVVELMAPLLPLQQANVRAAVLVTALEGPILHAAKYRPSLLKSQAFLDELCALALGYIERCQRDDAHGPR